MNKSPEISQDDNMENRETGKGLKIKILSSEELFPDQPKKRAALLNTCSKAASTCANSELLLTGNGASCE